MPKRTATPTTPETPTPEPQPQPQIKRHNQLVSEWEEIITPTSTPDEPDPLDALLAEIDADRSHTLIVERLPNYERDGRTDSRAVRKYCGRIEFDQDYRERIQSIWGAGHYRVSLRDRDGRLRRIWDVHIEHPPPPTGGAASATPPLLVSQPAAPDLSMLADVARQLATIRKAMGWDQPQQPVIVQPPEPAPQNPEDRRIELIVNLLSKNESLGEKVLQRILGDDLEPKDEGFLGTLARTLPELLALLRQASQQSTAPAAAQMPQSEQLTENTQPEPEQTENDEPYMMLIENLLREMAQSTVRGIVDQATIERGARWVEEFERDYPEWAHLIRNLVNGTPDSVLAALEMIYPDAHGISQSPIARQWVIALQQRLQKKSAT